jgi:hypothetical protein
MLSHHFMSWWVRSIDYLSQDEDLMKSVQVYFYFLISVFTTVHSIHPQSERATSTEFYFLATYKNYVKRESRNYTSPSLHFGFQTSYNWIAFPSTFIGIVWHLPLPTTLKASKQAGVRDTLISILFRREEKEMIPKLESLE